MDESFPVERAKPADIADWFARFATLTNIQELQSLLAEKHIMLQIGTAFSMPKDALDPDFS